ncbi:hypothetical protein K2X33_09885 [bacterium]|nr:hypothetical protein [bacterium]
MGLEYEFGRPEYDRLSPYLNTDPSHSWDKEVFIEGGEIGLRLKRSDGQPLLPRHPDLRFILDASSLSAEGQLTQAVFFPRRIAETYRQKGFELVVVRDWILNTALSETTEDAVPYLSTNTWEIQTNIAATQAPMAVGKQLAFFGTHDIADHLLGADLEGFKKLAALHSRAVDVLQKEMEGPRRHSRPHLLVSYLAGVVLDDAVQPRWYGSQTHAYLLEQSLNRLADLPCRPGPLDLPEAFHTVMAAARGENTRELAGAFQEFTAAL